MGRDDKVCIALNGVRKQDRGGSRWDLLCALVSFSIASFRARLQSANNPDKPVKYKILINTASRHLGICQAGTVPVRRIPTAMKQQDRGRYSWKQQP